MGTNFKFYGVNEIDYNQTFDFTSSSSALASYLYDNNYSTRLVSVGSDDLTPEVYTITFAAPVTADRVFIGYHNFKSFTIQYSDDSQVSWSDFSSAISESDNSANYHYYEVTEVSGITDLRVTANTTIVVDDQKRLGQLRLFSQLGEVSANPYTINPPYDENSKVHKLSDGGNVYVQFGRKMNMKINFDDASSGDLTLFRSLKDRYSPFYVYPNGGDSAQTQEPFRVQDMYFVNYINDYSPNLRNDFLLGIGTEIDLNLKEV